MNKPLKIISLGGSLIVPKEINIKFLEKFKKIILKNLKNYNFIIVCGGGITARNYINGLEKTKSNKKIFYQCSLGISATRLNARFMCFFFENKYNKTMPNDMEDVKNLIMKNKIVFSGALRHYKKETSDSTTAKLARFFNTEFINMTNVSGLYNIDPNKNENARIIPFISHKKFYKMVNKIRFRPGQHFVLDQKAARIIKNNNIKTYIIGPDINNFDCLLNNKKFIGTTIF
jgi:uridylate kinase